MFQLFYVSNAALKMDRQALRDLLEKARAKNRSLDITGMLLYRGGCFAQVLEGNEAAVTKLYGQIQADPRHEKITTMFSGEVGQREFPDWAMAFRDLSLTPAELDSFSDFLNQATATAAGSNGNGSSNELLGKRRPTSRHLLETFRRSLEASPEDL